MTVTSTRYDFSSDDAPTPGETWNIRFTVYERQIGADPLPATTFAAYSNWAFYLFDDILEASLGAAARVAAAQFYLTDSADPLAEPPIPGGITVGTPPYIDLEASAAETVAAVPGVRGYELWADVNSKPKRLAWGHFPVAP